MSERWTPEAIRALRERLGLSRSQFGRLLLGAEAKSAYSFAARIEESDCADFTRPSRPVCVLLDWLDAGGRPPHWPAVAGSQAPQAQGKRA